MITKKISIIVPCFNEEEALTLFYKEITKVFKSIGPNYELILVNDGSKDKTLNVMKQLSKKDKHVMYISFSRNFGKEAAMYAGLCNAKGYYVAIMDADMQDPPSLLPQMIEILESQEYDSVATRRVTRKGESKIRSFFARTFYKIINKISDADIVDGARDFRLMKRDMVDSIVSMNEYNRFSKGIFGWVGFNTYWLPFENVERVAGTTSWKFWGLVKYAINGIVNFSSFPVIFPVFLGLLFILVSFALFISLIFSYKDIKLIIGFMALFAGILLSCVGILGKYIGEIYLQSKNRPQYIIAESNIKKYS